MAYVIVGRKAQSQNICVVVCSQIFVRDGRFGKREKHVIRERRVIERAVKICVGRRCAARDVVRKSVCLTFDIADVFPGRRVRARAFQIFRFR